MPGVRLEKEARARKAMRGRRVDAMAGVGSFSIGRAEVGATLLGGSVKMDEFVDVSNGLIN